MYIKYDRISKCSYDIHAKSILEDTISALELKKAISYSKTMLKEKYDIKIVQLNPLILASSIPFNKINEKY